MQTSSPLRVRRALVATTALAPIAPALLAQQAQPNRMRKVGFLSAGSSADWVSRAPRAEEMRNLGWIEGQNYTLESRFAGGDYSRLEAMTRELVTLGVEVLIANGDDEAVAAVHVAPTLPIVVGVALDPLGRGYAKSLRQPGGSVTGLVWTQDVDITQRYAQFLKAVVPEMTRSGGIADGRVPALKPYREAFTVGARRLGFTHEVVEVVTPQGYDGAFATLAKLSVQAVVVYGSVMVFQERRRIVALARKHRLPDMYVFPECVELGGLMSYGVDIAAMYRRSAHYLDKILKGAAPGELAMELPTKYDLVINLKTAKELGRTVPESLRLQAARIVE